MAVHRTPTVPASCAVEAQGAGLVGIEDGLTPPEPIPTVDVEKAVGLVPVGSVIHAWEPSDSGLKFITEATIDAPIPLIGPLLTKLVRKFVFTNELIEAWILHNIEESGETERFVPQLYENSMLD